MKKEKPVRTEEVRARIRGLVKLAMQEALEGELKDFLAFAPLKTVFRQFHNTRSCVIPLLSDIFAHFLMPRTFRKVISSPPFLYSMGSVSIPSPLYSEKAAMVMTSISTNKLNPA